MKFKIRKPFAVHHERVIERQEAGRTVKVPVIESHFEEEVIDLPVIDAEKHLHKLEPADKEAEELFAKKYADNAAVSSARATSEAGGNAFPGLADAIAQGVAQALAAMGEGSKKGKQPPAA
jgi:hypothetical protein